jgi:hypothetical protein
VPGLSVGEALIEVADERGSLIGDCCHDRGSRLLQKTRFPQQHGCGEIVGDPNGLEVGREEQPAGSEDVVAIGICRVTLITLQHAVGRCRRSPTPTENGERREMPAPLSQPEVLVVSPGSVVALAPVNFATATAAMLAGTPRVELESAAVFGAHASVRRKQRLGRRSGKRAIEQRAGTFIQALQQCPEIPRRGNLLGTSGQLVGIQHRYTPRMAQDTGSTRT